MKPFSKAVKTGRKAVYLLLLTSLTGCWASKEETVAQLTLHMKAYENIYVTPGNAESVVKSTNLLLSKNDDNNFHDVLSLGQERTLNKAKNEAQAVISCAKTVESAKSQQSSGQWKFGKPESMTSTEWGSRLAILQEIGFCDKKVKALSTEQQSQLALATKEVSTNRETMLGREKAKQLADQRARKAVIDAARAKRLESCREVNQLLGRPAPTWEECLEQEESIGIGEEIMERGNQAERERQIKYNHHEAFKECDKNPNALFCDRR